MKNIINWFKKRFNDGDTVEVHEVEVKEITNVRHVGRPRKEEKDKRSKCVSVRFNDKEYEAVKEYASRFKMNTANYVRECVLKDIHVRENAKKRQRAEFNALVKKITKNSTVL